MPLVPINWHCMLQLRSLRSSARKRSDCRSERLLSTPRSKTYDKVVASARPTGTQIVTATARAIGDRRLTTRPPDQTFVLDQILSSRLQADPAMGEACSGATFSLACRGGAIVSTIAIGLIIDVSAAEVTFS